MMFHGETPDPPDPRPEEKTTQTKQTTPGYGPDLQSVSIICVSFTSILATGLHREISQRQIIIHAKSHFLNEND